MDIDSVRYFVQEEEYRFTHEAEKRMDERDVTIEQIEQALLNGRIVQEKPKQNWLPDTFRPSRIPPKQVRREGEAKVSGSQP